MSVRVRACGPVQEWRQRKNDSGSETSELLGILCLGMHACTPRARIRAYRHILTIQTHQSLHPTSLTQHIQSIFTRAVVFELERSQGEQAGMQELLVDGSKKVSVCALQSLVRLLCPRHLISTVSLQDDMNISTVIRIKPIKLHSTGSVQESKAERNCCTVLIVFGFAYFLCCTH